MPRYFLSIREAMLRTILISFWMLLAWPASADVVVIANPGNPVNQLSREQVVDIYMGRQTQFPDGQPALPIDQPPDSPIRAAYYQKLVSKTVPQVNAFWARLIFTGRATPPRILPDSAAVISQVLQNREAIAYVDSRDLDGRAKVLFRLP